MINNSGVILACQLIVADADFTEPSLREEIANDLWSLYQTTEFSSLKEKTINVPALIKPDNLIDSLIKELKDKESYVRGRAAYALGSTGNEKAIEPLKSALKDEGEWIGGKVKNNAFTSLDKIRWKIYKPLTDRHFLSDIKKHFHQRTWEMYIGVILRQKGLNVSSCDKGPDFIVDGRLYIECVGPTKGDPAKPDSVPKMDIPRTLKERGIQAVRG